MRIIGFLFLPLWSIATLASAQVGISHDALTCMSTNEFPMVEAELDTAELRGVRKAQVYFKANRTDEWYFVDMESGEGSELRAILPRPLAETNRVDYYVFVLSGTFEPWQTEEYSVHVSESGCGGGRAAVTSSPTSLTLRATLANQTPVPPGFQPTGISGLVTTSGSTVTVGSTAAGGGAASGGVSGITIGAVAAGAAAAAAGVAVANGGDEGNDGAATTGLPDTGSPTGGGVTPTTPSPSPSPTPSPTPTPTPSAPDVSGLWILDDRLVESCEPSLIGRTSRTGMTIQQNGTALTASREGPNFTENLSGTIDAAGDLSMRGPFNDEGDTGESSWEASTTSGSGSQMSGRYSRFYPAHNCTLRWTFSGSKS